LRRIQLAKIKSMQCSWSYGRYAALAVEPWRRAQGSSERGYLVCEGALTLWQFTRGLISGRAALDAASLRILRADFSGHWVCNKRWRATCLRKTVTPTCWHFFAKRRLSIICFERGAKLLVSGNGKTNKKTGAMAIFLSGNLDQYQALSAVERRKSSTAVIEPEGEGGPHRRRQFTMRSGTSFLPLTKACDNCSSI
jgi:hypothetical protein